MHDDFDTVVADRFKVLDHVPVPDTWSRVLDHMHASDTSSPVQLTEEVVTMIDVKTTDPTKPRQTRPMRVVVAGILAAAAAVVAIAFVVIRDADDATPSDEPSTTVPPTPFPRALLNATTTGELLEPGTYFVDEVTGKPTARILFTIGAGWSNQHGPGIRQNAIGWILFSRPYAVFSNACYPGPAADDNGIWQGARFPHPDPGPVATVDSLVAALSEQRGWADVTAPSDISVDGYAGKAFQRTVPADISNCDPGVYGPRTPPANWGSGLPKFRSWEGYEKGLLELYKPGEVETLWVLDIDGTVVVIHTRLLPSVTTGAMAMAGPSEDARAEFAAVLDSIRIELT